MQRHSRLIVAALALTLGTACSSTSVRVDWDTEVDFAAYQSVALAPGDRQPEPARPQMSPLVRSRIERATMSELRSRGLREARPRQADLIVLYRTAVHQEVRVVRTGYVGPRRWHYGWGWGTTHVHRYREGSLVVDLVDRAERRLVWRGVAEGAFTDSNPSSEAVQRVVASLFEGFPPTR